MASFSQLKSEVFSRELRREHHVTQIMGLNAYDRHRKFMNDYVNHYGRADRLETSAAMKLVKTDLDTVRETYRFIRTEEDDEDGKWEQRLAKRYYDKLFKEYCIADMSRYKSSKIGLRWRSEKEVIGGKGQFICGNKSCDETDDLHSYEVNFAYRESNENRQALVKLRVCPGCAHKLNYRKERKLAKQKAKEERRLRKRKRREDEDPEKSLRSDDDSASEDKYMKDGSDSEDSEKDEKHHAHGEVSKGPPSPRIVQAGTSGLLGLHNTAGSDDVDGVFDGMFL